MNRLSHMGTDIEFKKSSGNVFADMGLKDADKRALKADLAYAINEVIKSRGLTQTKAAELLGVDQPKVSELARGRLSSFSIERLFGFLVRLGQDVEIKVKPKPRNRNVAKVAAFLRSSGISRSKTPRQPLVNGKGAKSKGTFQKFL